MHHESSANRHRREIEAGERFAFGANWARFLELLTEQRISDAVESLRGMLGVDTLKGKSFLDIGSGSGLFSLAARRLGACVFSFDYDPQSVACTMELRRRYFRDDPAWQVQHGSVLDDAFLTRLGHFDVVYSWGVLHHTGEMWKAIENAAAMVGTGGTLFIALYNQQGLASQYWTFVKKAYNRYAFSRPIWVALHALYPTLPSILLKALRGQKVRRGMNPWVDLIDWLGGYPFEVSTPQEVISFHEQRGFQVCKVKAVGRKLGCNEFVFTRSH